MVAKRMNKERRQICVLIGTIIIVALFYTHTFFSNEVPGGGDIIGHYTVFERTVEIFQNILQGKETAVWFQDANTGYPLFYYYQPLPFVLVAIFALPLLAFPFISSLFVYKGAIIVVYITVPLAVFSMCLFMGCSSKQSFYAALLTFFVSSTEAFSAIGTFELKTIFHYGLFTHLFALPLLAMVIGMYYYLLKDPSIHPKQTPPSMKYHLFCIVLLAMLLYAHVLLGAIGCVCVLILYGIHLVKTKNNTRRIQIMKQGCIHFALFLVLVAPFLYFPITTISYYGGLDFSYDWYRNGVGPGFFMDYMKGDFLDFGAVFPVIAWLSIMGFCILGYELKSTDADKRTRAISILSLSFISAMLMAGIFTPILKSIPFAELFPIGRFIVLVQLLGIISAGYAVAKIETVVRAFLQRKKQGQQFIIFFYAALILIALTVPATQSYSFSFSLSDEHQDMLKELNKQPGEGRVYVHEDMKKEAVLMSEIIAMYTNKAVFNTVNGFHETISVVYNWFYSRDIQPTAWIDELFGAGYEVTYQQKTVRNYTTVLYESESYTIYGLPGGSLFDIVTVDAVLYSKPRHATDFVKKWMMSAMPIHKEYFMILDPPQEGAGEDIEEVSVHNITNIFWRNPANDSDYLFSGSRELVLQFNPIFSWDKERSQYTTQVAQETMAKNERCTNIHLRNQYMENGIYKATFDIDPQVILDEESNNEHARCYLLLRVSSHPHWEASVTDQSDATYKKEKVSIVPLSPSYMGVELDAMKPGVYEVEFFFRGNPLKGIALFPLFVSIFFLLCLFFEQKQSKKRDTVQD
jgi:hypothetical protein